MAGTEKTERGSAGSLGLSVTAGDALAAQMNGALPEGVEWDERELALLSLAQRQANDIQSLELVLANEGATVIGSTGQPRLNPAFAELRQSRLALARILGDIRLPDEGLGASRNAVKARAANARWDRERRNRGER